MKRVVFHLGANSTYGAILSPAFQIWIQYSYPRSKYTILLHSDTIDSFNFEIYL